MRQMRKQYHRRDGVSSDNEQSQFHFIPAFRMIDVGAPYPLYSEFSLDFASWLGVIFISSFSPFHYTQHGLSLVLELLS
jgi:hypothetical protein